MPPGDPNGDPVDIVLHGTWSDCPFCLALATQRPRIGKLVRVLTGFDSGIVGCVVDHDEDPDAFSYQRDGDPPGHSYRANRRHDLFLEEDAFAVPGWMLPLSIEDAGWVHQAFVLNAYEGLSSEGADALTSGLLRSLTIAWQRRLPLNGSDIWPTLRAHGWHPNARQSVVDRYDFGLRVLTDATSRKPIMRKRMAPLSQGRYLPRSRR